VLRGGSWNNNNPTSFRCANRNNNVELCEFALTTGTTTTGSGVRCLARTPHRVGEVPIEFAGG